MKIGVITFPGSLDDSDARRAVTLCGGEAIALWHGDADLHGVDALVLPGGQINPDLLRVEPGAISLIQAFHRAGMARGYAFARYRFKAKSAIFLGFMLTRAVPGIALSLPLFMLYARTGIIDTHFSLILTYVALNVPFTIWLIDGFFRQVPKDLAEAAQIDGCTPWQAFWQVEFPLAGPGIASAGIFAFLTSWNEYALASQITRSVNSKTLPVGLLDYTAEFTIDWRGMCALAVVMIIPALTLTFIIQKHLVSGLTFGAVKG